MEHILEYESSLRARRQPLDCDEWEGCEAITVDAERQSGMYDSRETDNQPF